MPLKVSDGMGAWIDDFKKSDAPQFKGKSAEERRDMAIAAYMSAKKGPKDEGKVDEISSNKLGDYMRKSSADAAKPGASARRQDKRIAGQSMADKKIRKKMGYSSTAKVPAGMNEAAGDCPDGQYYCQRTLTCKPIPDGMKKNAKGFLVKESVHSADKKPEKYIGADGKVKTRMVPADKEVVKKEDKAADRDALQKAMDIYKKRGGKITKVAPGKAAGYHGKDDPGKDMAGMMDKGDTKAIGTRKKVKSMGEAKQTHMFDNEKDARAKAKEIGGKYVKGTGKSAGKHAAIKELSYDKMNKYHDAAQKSKDRATNSAVATILRKGDHSQDLKTRAKRIKGMELAKTRSIKKIRGDK